MERDRNMNFSTNNVFLTVTCELCWKNDVLHIQMVVYGLSFLLFFTPLLCSFRSLPSILFSFLSFQSFPSFDPFFFPFLCSFFSFLCSSVPFVPFLCSLPFLCFFHLSPFLFPLTLPFPLTFPWDLYPPPTPQLWGAGGVRTPQRVTFILPGSCLSGALNQSLQRF